ncbi:MAG: cold-shock protein [Flavobacteriales bacterium]
MHINKVQGEITEGDKVTFELEKGPKGLVAANVKKI